MSSYKNLYTDNLLSNGNLNIVPTGEILIKTPISNQGAATKLYVDESTYSLPVIIVNTQTFTLPLNKTIIACKYSNTGKQTLTLPNNVLGKVYHITDTDGNAYVNNITIVTSNGLINGSTGVLLNGNYQSFSIFSDGTNWFIF